MKLKKVTALIMAAAMAAGLTACGGSSAPASTTAANSGTESKAAEAKPASDEKPVTMDLATAYAADSPAGQALAAFVEDVREQSGGSIDISLFTDGTLGNTTDNYKSVSSGDLDMTMSGLEGLDLYAPEYTFLDAPFLIKDWAHQEAILNSGIGDKLKERYEENGIVTLGWHKRDVRVLSTNKKVETPADVNGLRLRLPGMTVYVDTWTALGVTSTTIAMNELYTGLQQKMADASEGGYEQMNTLKLYEVQDYIEETNHVYEFVGLFINKDLFESMSENQQKILMDCAEKHLAEADNNSADKRAEYKQACIDGGMESVELDTAPFRTALEDYYKKQFESKWTVTTYDEVMGFAK